MRCLRKMRLSVWGLALALVAMPSSPARSASMSRISVEPSAIRLDVARSRQQVAVTAHFADGSLRDLTAEATYEMDAQEIATVDSSGVIRPVADGATTVRIAVDDCDVEVPIEVRDSGSQRPYSYRRDVAAVLSRAGCNMGSCHGNPSGKGGFRLSFRGDNPGPDFLALTRDTFGRRINRQAPDSSLILLKPTGRVPHEGGLRFDPDSPEAEALRGWVADGAIDDADESPALVKLEVWPPERLIAAPGLSQQLVVTAEFADGARRDVTREASYELDDPTKADITTEGRVVAHSPSEVAVAVRYLDGRGVSRLAFLHDRPDFAWTGGTASNAVDKAIFAKLRALKINPSPICSDEVFVRRAYLDALGVLPEPEEVRAFLDDTAPDKQARLVDRLLSRPEFADFWALKWADLLRNEEKTMGPKGVWVFQRWLRDQIAADVPLDEFARQIVASRGSTWSNPPASFHRTNLTPESAAEAVGQVFLGVRLQCARCHNHPYDVWTQDDYYGLAAYFSNIDIKVLNNQRRDRFDKHEINGDVVVHLSGRPRMVQPRSGEMMGPKPLGGPSPELSGDPDALDDLADWLTRDNPQFARNMANRVWFHLLGRGIVDPVDDFRGSNPPSNPALLDAITDHFVANGMRLKPLVRWIMTSQTYGLASTPNETNADDEVNFARARVKMLPAEVLLDEIGQALDHRESLDRSSGQTRAVQLPGVKMGGEFLKVFGKPDRLLTCECERSEATTLAQAFQLINGEAVRERLEARDNRIGRLLEAEVSEDALLEELYLATLSRRPTDEERSGVLSHLSRSDDQRKAWEDVAWALLNSKEFLLRH